MTNNISDILGVLFMIIYLLINNNGHRSILKLNT